MKLKPLYLKTFVTFFVATIAIFISISLINTSYVKIETSVSRYPSGDLYHYYSTLPRPSTPDYALYVLNPYDDTYISSIAQNFTYDDIVHLSFVEYKSDEEIHNVSEYPQYPVETLTLKTGDCEDIAILQCSLLREKGYETALIRIEGHMGCGVKEGESYKWIRELEVMHGQNETYHVIKDRPILSIEGKYTNDNIIRYTSLQLNITNHGNVVAENCVLFIDPVFSSDPFTINPFETKHFDIHNILRGSPENIKIISNENVLKEMTI